MRYLTFILISFLISCSSKPNNTYVGLNPEAFKRQLESSESGTLIDLRALGETSGTIIKNAQIITYNTDKFTSRINELDKNTPVFLYCKTGNRSLKAMEVLRNLAFKEVYMLNGGIDAWMEKQLPVDTPSKSFWNNMYGTDEYLYGVRPNEFLQSCLEELPIGKILLPADGEGRNSVYAASQRWEVQAFDISEKGRNKALKLAGNKGVNIDFFIADFSNPQLAPDTYDAVALIYAHMPREVRLAGFEHVKNYLKPGGTLIIEAFSPNHLKLGSPFGPKTNQITYSIEELQTVFSTFDILQLEEITIQLDEGRHKGPGTVVRMKARKK